MNSFFVKEALQILEREGIEFKFYGDKLLQVTHARKFNEIDLHSVCFNRHSSFTLPETIPEALIILQKGSNIPKLISENTRKSAFLFVENPTLCFCLIASLLEEKKEPYFHESVVISKKATIGSNVTIGAFTFVGDNVRIMDNVSIGQGCFVDNAVIGENTQIFSGVKIGAPGLGSQKDASNRWHDFPHFGRVLIGKNVVIQDNTVINQGTLNDTTIGDGVRIAPLCCIAHGVSVGANSFICQGVIVAGSVTIGENTTLWGNCSLRDGVSIGIESVAGMGSVVVKNVPDRETWVGNPAQKLPREDNVK